MQKKSHSLLESIGNTAVGFVISVCIWEFIVKPLWGLTTSFGDNLAITGIFTVASIARVYVLRRIGNRITVQQQKQKDVCNEDLLGI